ncbi:DgyrCDS11346 [Dimorphilus gyrociliatus]|uniref:DgyrCDS11346 n=1 Tax=Dimorphilus gyrociliatus TaxID=2664684 RepID=A0A7I8W5J8_9ANNE|nr:DgyrCDS11346 [Dimorphilus gyrociliatus]
MATVEERLALYRQKRLERFDREPKNFQSKSDKSVDPNIPGPTQDISDKNSNRQKREENIFKATIKILSRPINDFVSFFMKTKLGRVTNAISESKALIALKVGLWLVLFGLFVELEFGFVFVVISIFFIIFINLGSRKRGEKSAYSVFNENCERLDGTFTAEQFERELRHGSSSVR